MNTIGPVTTLRISHLPPHLLLDQVRDEDPPLHVLPGKQSGKEIDEATGIPDAEMARPGTGVRDLRQQRQEKERKMIDEALTAAGGNVSKAARMLNVSRQLVHYKMHKYGLSRQHYRKG
jgi:DNA-binding NtrC family response regulator